MKESLHQKTCRGPDPLNHPSDECAEVPAEDHISLDICSGMEHSTTLISSKHAAFECSVMHFLFLIKILHTGSLGIAQIV